MWCTNWKQTGTNYQVQLNRQPKVKPMMVFLKWIEATWCESSYKFNAILRMVIHKLIVNIIMSALAALISTVFNCECEFVCYSSSSTSCPLEANYGQNQLQLRFQFLKQRNTSEPKERFTLIYTTLMSNIMGIGLRHQSWTNWHMLFISISLNIHHWMRKINKLLLRQT